MDALLEKVRTVFQEWEPRFREEIGHDEPNAESGVSFLQHCVAFMMLDGPAPRNLERIEVFLNDQLPSAGAPIRMTFWGGVHDGAGVYVRDLQFDFADAWLMDGFDMVCATRAQWTPEEIEGFLAAVQEDFAFDGYLARIWVIGAQSGREVRLGCDVLDATLGIFRSAEGLRNADQLLIRS